MTTTLCPICQASNPLGMFFCERCGADLTENPRSPKKRPPEPPRINAARPLALLIDGRSYECADGDILGRSGTVCKEFFNQTVTVSRQHVSLHFRDGQWSLRVCPNVSNVTELDGKLLAAGGEEPLLGEHHLLLSKKCEVILRVGNPNSL